MKVAIIGTRDLPPASRGALLGKMDAEIPRNCTEIVSGGAEGIDRLAEEFAERNKLRLKIFRPDYGRYGREAPLKRNIEIVDYAQYIIAFWDGKSRGTAYTLTACIERGKPFKIVNI